MSAPQMETRSLPCPLSDEDFKLRSHNLAVARHRQREIESDKKAANARFAQQLKDVNEEIDRLAGVVKTRTEHRPVTVEWVSDHKAGMMRLIRLDTETEIDSKPMTMAERQETLKFNVKKNGAPPADKAEAKPEGNGKSKKNGKANGAKAPAAETTPAS